MEQIFLFVLNNAITVNALIVAIIAVRALGKKMPKWIICMLWLIVAVKLIVPVHFESGFSLIPTREPIPTEIVMEKSAQGDSGVSSLDNEKDFASDTMTDNSYGNVTQISDAELTGNAGSVDNDSILAKIEQVMFYLYIGWIVWAAGMGVMLMYAVITYILTRKRVSASVKTASGVYECDDISDSFILGIISPRVYLPSTLSEDAKGYILKHEFAHLSRYDHVWKPLGFVILSVYWFNPLCWIAYILLCRDIEYACDEKVARNIEKIEKAEYCRVLLEYSIPRSMIAACPVAFGGIDVKSRIKNVANYKKPAFWITVASIMVCVGVGVCFATSRGTEEAKVDEKASQAQAENVGKQSVDGKWYGIAAAGDCILLEKQQPKQDTTSYEYNMKNIFESPEAALKVLESDGEDWGMIASDDNYVVLARREQIADGNLTSESDARWDEQLRESNNSILKEYLADDSANYMDMILKMRGDNDLNN